MNSVCYIYDVDFCDLEGLRKADTREELAKFVDSPLRDLSHNAKRQSELKKTSHDVFDQNDKENFCDHTTRLIKPGDYCQLFCSALQRSSPMQIIQSFTEEKAIANDGECKEVDIKEKEVFEVG